LLRASDALLLILLNRHARIAQAHELILLLLPLPNGEAASKGLEQARATVTEVADVGH
jgi:hypothetical protein